MPNEETFLDVDSGDAVEPMAVPAGEHKVRVLSGTVDTDKNGDPYFLPRFEVPSVATSKDFTDYIRLPNDSMTDKQLNTAKWRLEAFKQCFGLKSKGKINLANDLPGLEGWAILGMRDDPEYGEQNFIRKYILPK